MSKSNGVEQAWSAEEIRDNLFALILLQTGGPKVATELASLQQVVERQIELCGGLPEFLAKGSSDPRQISVDELLINWNF